MGQNVSMKNKSLCIAFVAGFLAVSGMHFAEIHHKDDSHKKFMIEYCKIASEPIPSFCKKYVN